MLVELQDETPMAVLGPDDFCGEEALLLEVPRNAYVRASEAEGGLQLLALSKADLLLVLHGYPALADVRSPPPPEQEAKQAEDALCAVGDPGADCGARG